MVTHSLDLTSLGSGDIDMENSVATCWNDEGSTNVDEPGTPESRCTTIDNEPVVSPYVEGTACNNIPCIQQIKPNPDDSLALVLSDSHKQKYNSILDASDSAITVYNRQAQRRRENGVSKVEMTTGDRGPDVECSSRFPTEIYELIIDYVAGEPHFGGLRHFGRWWPLVRFLARCALVCRAWVPRAQMHLFYAIDLSKTPSLRDTHLELTSFRAAVQRKPFLLPYIKLLCIANDSLKSSQITILSSYHMPSLKACSISSLNLAEVHPSLYRFPSSATSLQILWLDFCLTGDANQLCRFLTSFRSLAIVVVTWSQRKRLRRKKAPTFGGRDLPHLQFNRSKCSLQTLALTLGRNLPALLKTFIKARPFVSHLRHLILAYPPGIRSSLQDITELLEHCSQSLEEVTVILGSWLNYLEIVVSSLCTHLGLNASEEEIRLFSDMVKCLDDTLSQEMFRAFRKLRIRARVNPIEFPKLKERKVDIDFSDKDDSISY
ncbi:hypothetical protein QCA50_013494 [Cerrena zonata]|uniref:F-box domain-containing protein n=1 Tax=Cerrena zonata TaxID=2478898 RepID=A0AAW0G0Z9_9APHY